MRFAGKKGCLAWRERLAVVPSADAGASVSRVDVSRSPGIWLAAAGVAAVLVASAVALPGAALAESDRLVATSRFSGATVGFDLGGSYRNVTLTVTGPNGFSVSASSERTAPVINLRKFGDVEDGRYSYQLSAATTKRMKPRSQLDNGRGDTGEDMAYAGVSASGSFLIKDGAIYQPPEREER